jgi:hypothetical protein
LNPLRRKSTAGGSAQGSAAATPSGSNLHTQDVHTRVEPPPALAHFQGRPGVGPEADINDQRRPTEQNPAVDERHVHGNLSKAVEGRLPTSELPRQPVTSRRALYRSVAHSVLRVYSALDLIR